jgi:hypothetical protein
MVKKKFFNLLITTTIALAMLWCFPAAGSAISLTGWTGVGTYGTLGADGDVTLSPFGDSQYGYVTTNGGVFGVGLPGVGGTGNATNGSVVTSPLFNANANDSLNFYFNYITSDGGGFADYAWAQLLDDSDNEVSLLFTARTTPGGDTVPGFSMPAPTATLVPDSTPIIPGAPTWSPLGGYSNSCFSDGCGYTGWIQASYDILIAGAYKLSFGVVNWNDTIFHSGMAFDGATIAGVPIDDPTPVPEPGIVLLLGMGLLGVFSFRRNRLSK